MATMTDTNLTIDRTDIETGAYIKTVTSGGRYEDDVVKAGIVDCVETEYNHVLDEEQTFVYVTDGDDEWRINISHFEDDNDSVRVTEYHVSDDGDEDDDEEEYETKTEIWTGRGGAKVVEVVRDENGQFVTWEVMTDDDGEQVMPTLEDVVRKYPETFGDDVDAYLSRSPQTEVAR